MSINVPTEPRRLLLAVLVTLLGLTPWPAAAQDEELPPGEALRRAESLLRDNKLARAAALYHQALRRATDRADRRLCYERLLAIYAHSGRQDQAIRVGREYLEWLNEAGERERSRDLEFDLGRWYFLLGHYGAAEPHLRRSLRAIREVPPSPTRQITALTCLALGAQKQGDRDRAERAWREVEAFARARLEDPRGVEPSLRIECARGLADSYRFQGRPGDAVPHLERILPAFDELRKPDWLGKRDTLRQLASFLLSASRPADAETRLKEALHLHERYAGGDRIGRGDLACELAVVLEQLKRPKEADAQRQRGSGEYRAILDDVRAGRLQPAAALAAFWRLLQLYQRNSQYDQALQLTRDQGEHWAGSLFELRLNAEKGRLQVLLGDYKDSLQLLGGVVAELEKQDTPNLVELPPALLNLAVAELATGLTTDGRSRAELAGRRCLGLYEKHGLPDDLVLVEACNLLGTCAAHEGDYARAIEHFRAGVARCARLGSSADPAHCNLLLNIALLHKAQGDLGRSLAVCQEARTVYKRFASPEALGFAALDAAAASLLTAQARLVEANELASAVLRGCKEHGIQSGPLVVTARHCQALFHLSRREYGDAERAWLELEKLHGPQSPLRPRTLNYLALTCECRGQADRAAELYEEARRLQRHNPQASPGTQATTLFRLASLADRRKQPRQSRALLEEAVTVIEKARTRTYGDSLQRTLFFSQFASVYEQLVAQCLHDGDVPAAVVAVARSRSRSLQDQLELANVDPIKGLSGPEGEKLRRQEGELRRRIAALRASVPWVTAEAEETQKTRQARAELNEAQEQYNEVYREILNLHPTYRELRSFTPENLEQLRQRAVGPKKLLLVYHVGRGSSHLLLLGDPARTPEAFALAVPKELAAGVAAPPAATVGKGSVRGRGIGLGEEREQPDLPPAPRARGELVPLGGATLRALVENYLEQIGARTFKPSRGIALRSQDESRPLPTQRPDFLADILLPPAVRQRIREIAPEGLIVVPDGALHKMPLEGVLIRSGEKPVYVLDQLPPIAYAPSVAILAQLAERPLTPPSGLKSLLTVADPAYPNPKDRLEHTARESARIGEFFGAGQVVQLRGRAATQKGLTEALPGRDVVHIAAHGLALPDDRFGNQFAALLLTPTPKAGPEDDGYLALHEVYTLGLKKCELAILSACDTNVGPQQPLEAGVTLAGGFLAAGARRVVASHWDVDDNSTADLMAAFFRKLMEGPGNRSLPYARALQEARRQVRDQPGCSSPYYWAPFVLLGPAD